MAISWMCAYLFLGRVLLLLVAMEISLLATFLLSLTHFSVSEIFLINSMVILIFGVMEAALGLSLITCISRHAGADFFSV